jgi:sporulation protein YlmC with PRC-barrel domain
MTAYLSLEALRRHKVVNRASEALGHVDDFILDPQSGEVRYLILAAGGLLGVGDKLFAIPFGEIVVDDANERLILPFGVAAIKEAPGFLRGKLPDFAPAYRKDIEGFYAARKAQS